MLDRPTPSFSLAMHQRKPEVNSPLQSCQTPFGRSYDSTVVQTPLSGDKLRAALQRVVLCYDRFRYFGSLARLSGSQR